MGFLKEATLDYISEDYGSSDYTISVSIFFIFLFFFSILEDLTEKFEYCSFSLPSFSN